MSRPSAAALGVRPLGVDEVRVSVEVEDAQGFVHHYDDIVTTSGAATGALRLLAHMGVRNVLT